MGDERGRLFVGLLSGLMGGISVLMACQLSGQGNALWAGSFAALSGVCAFIIIRAATRP